MGRGLNENTGAYSFHLWSAIHSQLPSFFDNLKSDMQMRIGCPYWLTGSQINAILYLHVRKEAATPKIK